MTRKREQGFGLVTAIFVLVVLATAGIALVDLGGTLGTREFTRAVVSRLEKYL